RLARDYPALDEQKRIAAPLAALLERALKRGVSVPEMGDALRRMQQLQGTFPHKPALAPIAESPRQRAHEMAARAQGRAKGTPQRQEPKALARHALQAAPNSTEIRTVWRNLVQRATVLRVGVRELPTYLSPAWAATDAERRAVELLFEGLVKL